MIKSLEKLLVTEYQPLGKNQKSWVCTVRQIAELNAKTNTTRCGYMEHFMMAEWVDKHIERNTE